MYIHIGQAVQDPRNNNIDDIKLFNFRASSYQISMPKPKSIQRFNYKP